MVSFAKNIDDNVEWIPSNRKKKRFEGISCNTTRQLNGEITPSGSKNVGLKILSLIPMFGGKISLTNVPRNNQIRYFLDLLRSFGVDISILSNSLKGFDLVFNASNISRNKFQYEEIRWCRHAFLMAISILVRTGSVIVPLPGYSHYGSRPIDGQLKGLSMMGAKVHPIHNGDLFIEIPPAGLTGQEIFLEFPSNAVTEAILWASVAAKGETIINGASQEPDIVDMCSFLKKAGISITGEGTPFIKIKGEGAVSHHSTITYSIPTDRIEVATLGAAITIVGGEMTINDIDISRLTSINAVLKKLGTCIEEFEHGWRIYAHGRPKASNITTGPYPAFPTDAQGPFLSALALADGTSILHEKMWSNRLSQAMELKRMGANIEIVNGQIAIARGVERLSGAKVCGTDPRATIGLILAGLVAEGETIVSGIDLLDNAYDSFDEKLRLLGADVKRVVLSDSPYSLDHPIYGRLEAF